MSTTYNGFLALRNAIAQLPQTGNIYTRLKVTKTTIMDAEFVVVGAREPDGYVTEKGGYIADFLAGKNYHKWFEVQVIVDIITDRLERDDNAPVTDLVDAIFYYDEFDTFKDAG